MLMKGIFNPYVLCPFDHRHMGTPFPPLRHADILNGWSLWEKIASLIFWQCLSLSFDKMLEAQTTDTQRRHKSKKKNEILGRDGRKM